MKKEQNGQNHDDDDYRAAPLLSHSIVRCHRMVLITRIMSRACNVIGLMDAHVGRKAISIRYLLFPVGSELTSLLVVPGETVDTGLDQNKTELGISVLPVTLKVLANSNSLLDQVVKVFGDLRSQTVGFEDTEDLVTSNVLDLGNTVLVTIDRV